MYFKHVKSTLNSPQMHNYFYCDLWPVTSTLAPLDKMYFKHVKSTFYVVSLTKHGLRMYIIPTKFNEFRVKSVESDQDVHCI